MFFLRCAFWLSIVYASMSWPNGVSQPSDLGTRAIAAGQAVSSDIMNKAATKVADVCSHHPSECLADVARLTRLIEGGRAPGAAHAAVKEDARSASDVPLPIAVPRRHVRDAKLAHKP